MLAGAVCPAKTSAGIRRDELLKLVFCGSQFLDYVALCVIKGQARRTICCDLHSNPSLSISTRERDAGYSLVIVSNPHSRFAIIDSQPSKSIVFIVNTCKLHDLSCTIFVERETAP